MSVRKPSVRNRDELILEVWRGLGSKWVGAAELREVQRALVEEFGVTGAPSPASIARTLAEHGGRLRHSEVLSFDSNWRLLRLTELFAPGELDFKSVDSAVDSMQKLDELQIHFNSEGDQVGLARLHELVVELKAELNSLGESRLNLGTEQRVAAEVIQWLTIWLQTPHIFPDWLKLRLASEQFRKKFDTDYTDSDKDAP